MKYPWMPLFWGDFLANTMHLSAQEAGAYLFLIAHAWEHDAKVPRDWLRLARIARVRPDQWKRVWNSLENFFEPCPESSIGTSSVTLIQCYSHPRVADELRRLGKISNERKAAAMQLHSKSSAKGYANDMLTRSRSSAFASTDKMPRGKAATNYKPGGMSPDKGDDYRSPPRTKCDNVLGPRPVKSVSLSGEPQYE